MALTQDDLLWLLESVLTQRHQLVPPLVQGGLNTQFQAALVPPPAPVAEALWKLLLEEEGARTRTFCDTVENWFVNVQQVRILEAKSATAPSTGCRQRGDAVQARDQGDEWVELVGGGYVRKVENGVAVLQRRADGFSHPELVEQTATAQGNGVPTANGHPYPSHKEPLESLASPGRSPGARSRAKSVNQFKAVANIDNMRELRERFVRRDFELHGVVPTMTPIVQFESAIFFCAEEDPVVEVGVMRIGDVSKQSSVRFETRDGSAKAGRKYTARHGEITFEPGERHKSITVATTNDEIWDATLEFQIVLLPNGLRNVQLGRYLWVCRVKIIDNDVFPTNRYALQIETGTVDKISVAGLLTEYCKMNYMNPVVRLGTGKQLLIAQVETLYFIMCLFLDLFLVDKVLCDDCDSSRAGWLLFVLCVLRVVPFPALHFLEYQSVFWKVQGASRKTLQSNLLRKYFNYDEMARAEVNESKLIMAMSRDAGELVKDGYCNVVPLFSALMRLVLILLYQLSIPTLLAAVDDREDVRVDLVSVVQQILPALTFPILMAIFLRIRNPVTLQSLLQEKTRQNDMLYHVRQTMQNYDMIRDYRKRGWFVEMYEKKIADYNQAFVATSAVVVNNKKFAPWITLITILVTTYILGLQVVQRPQRLSLGTFLNMLAVYAAIGDAWGEVYRILLEMQNTTEALSTMVTYLNMTTDVRYRLMNAGRNVKMNRQALIDLSKEDKHAEKQRWDPADQLCIELRELTFQYTCKGRFGNEPCLKGSCAMLPQGGLYTLVGPPGEGKGTILKLLGEVLIWGEGTGGPEGNCGDLMMPAHLRALHISKEPLFIEGTLFTNLTFGCSKCCDGNDDDGRLERVLEICEMLELPQGHLETIREDTLVCPWLEVLASTDLSLLHIARGLVCNPEIICIHKPTLFLNNEMATAMYGVLKAFVEQRGLGLSPAGPHVYGRRPRTCVVSARRIAGPAAEAADAVYYVGIDCGMKLVDPKAMAA